MMANDKGSSGSFSGVNPIVLTLGQGYFGTRRNRVWYGREVVYEIRAVFDHRFAAVHFVDWGLHGVSRRRCVDSPVAADRDYFFAGPFFYGFEDDLIGKTRHASSRTRAFAAGGTMETQTRGNRSGIPAEDLGTGPGMGQSAMRLLMLAICGAIVMPWVSYRALNFHNMSWTPVTSTATSAAMSSANVVGDAAKAVKDTAAVTLGTTSTVRLPNGTEVSAPAKGAEAALLNFLTNSPEASTVTSVSVDLDRVSFENGSATLQLSSAEQLKNIAAILKAYPTSSVEIQGAADQAQNAAVAAKLSTGRAQQIKQELAAQGVPSAQMSVAGTRQRSDAMPTGPGKNGDAVLVVTKK
jgi:outer membrane protein OmpA-like peptidoglycan-associated protein